MYSRIAVVAAALLVAAACSSPLAPGVTRHGSPHYGVVTQIWSPEIARWTGDLGTGWVRLDANWFELEPAPGVFDWGRLDTAIFGAQAAGVRVYATLAYTPSWAGPCQACMPDDPGDWRRFVEAVLLHYHDSGTVFGIWNEPNLGLFLEDTADGANYTRLFAEANAARQAVDPTAALGGPETSHHAFPAYYGAVMGAVRPYMRPDDVVSVHYYADAPLPLAQYMAGVALEAGRRPVWLTETGIDTCEDEPQRQFFADVLKTYTDAGRTWWANVFPYVLYNGRACGALVNPDGSYRPAFLTYRAAISARP